MHKPSQSSHNPQVNENGFMKQFLSEGVAKPKHMNSGSSHLIGGPVGKKMGAREQLLEEVKQKSSKVVSKKGQKLNI